MKPNTDLIKRQLLEIPYTGISLGFLFLCIASGAKDTLSKARRNVTHSRKKLNRLLLLDSDEKRTSGDKVFYPTWDTTDKNLEKTINIVASKPDEVSAVVFKYNDERFTEDEVRERVKTLYIHERRRVLSGELDEAKEEVDFERIFIPIKDTGSTATAVGVSAFACELLMKKNPHQSQTLCIVREDSKGDKVDYIVQCLREQIGDALPIKILSSGDVDSFREAKQGMFSKIMRILGSIAGPKAVINGNSGFPTTTDELSAIKQRWKKSTDEHQLPS